MAVLAIALIAGGSALAAARLALSMTLLQFAIGAANDLVDAPRDVGRTPAKPIPAGLVSVTAARVVLVLATTGGLVLAGLSGVAALAIAVAGVVCGFVYDLRLSRSVVSWLPLAVALPLVPFFGWVGVTTTLPPMVLAITPIAGLAGIGLAIGNALIDVESDSGEARRTVAVALGRWTAWRLHALALGFAVLLAAIFLPSSGGLVPPGVIVVGACLLGLGVVAVARLHPRWHRVAWQLEAGGSGLIGVGWILAAATGFD